MKQLYRDIYIGALADLDMVDRKWTGIHATQT